MLSSENIINFRFPISYRTLQEWTSAVKFLAFHRYLEGMRNFLGKRVGVDEMNFRKAS